MPEGLVRIRKAVPWKMSQVSGPDLGPVRSHGSKFELRRKLCAWYFLNAESNNIALQET